MNSFLSRILKLVKNDFFLLTFLYYVIAYWKQPIKQNTQLEIHTKKSKPEIIVEYIFKVIEFIYSKSPKKSYYNIIETVEIHDYAFDFFKSLISFLNYKNIYIGSYYIVFDFSDLEEIKNQFLDFVYKYNKIDLNDDFYVFDFTPKMSSGEMSFLTIYSRIYDCISHNKQIIDNDEIILFLDEAETTLHPEWQRKLISQIITFLEEFVENKKIHVIFASHSPFLLSDIPDSNVVFLKKDPENKMDSKTKKDHEEISKTFGANIHTLLAKSFFLNKTIGEFASRYIERTCDMIEEIQDISMLNKMLPIINQRINNVAEEFIRIGLQRNLFHKIESLKTLSNKKELKEALKLFIDELEEEK